MTKGEPDSINHLRGACDRLLIENPDNGSLLLLRGLSRLLIPKYNKDDAIADMRKGWKIFTKKENWSKSDYLLEFNKYYNIAREYDSSMIKYLDNEILNDHLFWLKEFNSKFLKGLSNA